MKSLVWMGSSIEAVRAFPEDARQRAGYELYQVQCGLTPSDWKPMVAIGAGVQEIRIHTKTEYRIIYTAKFADAVYVLHAFEKKTGRTKTTDVDLARKRLATVLAARRAKE